MGGGGRGGRVGEKFVRSLSEVKLRSFGSQI